MVSSDLGGTRPCNKVAKQPRLLTYLLDHLMLYVPVSFPSKVSDTWMSLSANLANSEIIIVVSIVILYRN